MELDPNNALHLTGKFASFITEQADVTIAEAQSSVTRLNLAVSGVTGNRFPGQFTIQTGNPNSDSYQQYASVQHYAQDTGAVEVMLWDGRGNTSVAMNGILGVGNHIGGYPLGDTAAGVAGLKQRMQLGVTGTTGAAYPGLFIYNTYNSGNPGDPSTDTMEIRHVTAAPIANPASGPIWSITRGGFMKTFVGQFDSVNFINPATANMTTMFLYSGRAGDGNFVGFAKDKDAIITWSNGTPPSGAVSIGGWSSNTGIRIDPPLNNVVVYGNFGTVGGTKAFIVPHPLDDTKDLWHACLEGPENGVFYRGEAVVVDGYAEVTLPDYFEALTFSEDRSVQLTQIFEGGTLFARMAASRIVGGKFTIHATEAVTVAWEVKAVRRVGVDRLQVVADKYVPPITDDEPMMPKTTTKTAKGKVN